MKLQKELQFATEKLNALIERKGLATIKKYMADVYNAHEWQNYETRIANDVVKYAAIGRDLCALLDRNPEATDQHITTLCVAVMKSAGLLPFNPAEAPDNKPADKKAELLEKAETVPALTDDLTRDEIKAAADALQDVADELAAIGYHSDAFAVRCRLDYFRHAYMKKAREAEKINTPTADRVARESLEWRTTNELARLKAALNSEWEKAHAAGLYDVAARVSEQTGRISNEQARRLQARADSIPEGVAVAFADGEFWPVCVFGFSVYDDLMKAFQVDDFNYFATEAEAVAFCRANYPRTPFEVHVISRADAINSTEGALLRDVYARRRVGRRLEVKQYPYTIIPDNVGTLAAEYSNAELAAFLTDDKQHAETLAHSLTRLELAVLVDKTNDEDPDNTPTTGEKSDEGTTQAPTTDNAPTSPAKGEGEAVGDFCPLTGCNLTDDGQHLTPAEVKAQAHDDEAQRARKYAEKLANAKDEVLNNLFGTTDRVALLANYYELTDDEARALLACYSTSEKSGEATTLQTAGEIKPDKNRAPRLAPVAACVLYLLSLTIGNGKPATMYTDDPAAVVAQVTEAGETLTAYEWHPVPTPDALPPYDVPALA